ncbi:MAG: transglutaminase-like domain-containing protein [Clostridia bacterium]|nr:transglutaminase-like domain-containing protein [Clostridia bacterium]
MMNKRRISRTLSLVLVAVMALTAFAAFAVAEPQSPPAHFHGDFQGKWEGNVAVELAAFGMEIDDVWTFNIDVREGTVLFSTQEFVIDFMPCQWEMNGGQLAMTIFGGEVITLAISEDGQNLLINIEQPDASADFVFAKLDDVPEAGSFAINGVPLDLYSYEDRVQQLNDFAAYADDGVVIPFVFDLNRRDLYADLIEAYDLDSVTAGYTDVELMIVLLHWICDHFNHNGMAFPARPDVNAITIVEFLEENPDGANCRTLAILLAELLRLYGIEATHVTGLSMEETPAAVHVFTHAYSRELKQWIYLDPTFNLYLQDEDGNYLSLVQMRESFAGGSHIFANENAGHNAEAFDMDEYKDFMIEYLFRFMQGTHFTFGSEDGKDDHPVGVLVPVGYEIEVIPPEHMSHIVALYTTDPDTYWPTF